LLPLTPDALGIVAVVRAVADDRDPCAKVDMREQVRGDLVG
jgi:hypothetical protein